jgi:protein pelota
VALSSDPDRACYGYSSVVTADAMIAVDSLLVTDKLFKAADVIQRRMYVDLVDSVRLHGGTVHILSSMHVSGEQLDKFTGVAATLRFPCPETEISLQDMPGDSDSDSDSDSSCDGDIDPESLIASAALIDMGF